MSTQVQQLRRFNSMERRPRMLKDFLTDNLNSCSSSGFKSFPRKPTSMHTLIEMELKSSSPPSNSPFQILMNTIRSISFFTSIRKSPSVLSLPRSLSRKLSSSRRRTTTTRRSRSQGCSDISITTVKIKDIIRWKSFRDIVEPPPPPLDFMVDPTVTTTTTATWSISSGSSWSESDFLTSSWEDPQNDSVEASKRFSFSPLVVGKDPKATVSNNLLSQIFVHQWLSFVLFYFFCYFSFWIFPFLILQIRTKKMKLVENKVEEHCSSTIFYFILFLSVGGQLFNTF